MRVLILIVIGLLLYIIISNLLRRVRFDSADKPAVTEKMVKCDYCGLHILERDALKQQENYFCSKEHLDLAR